MANSVNPGQTAPIGAVCSGPTLFASILNSSVMLGKYLQQTTFSKEYHRLALLHQQHIHQLPWPSKSLDLNVIENLWDELNRSVRRHTAVPPRNLQELQHSLIRNGETSDRYSCGITFYQFDRKSLEPEAATPQSCVL